MRKNSFWNICTIGSLAICWAAMLVVLLLASPFALEKIGWVSFITTTLFAIVGIAVTALIIAGDFGSGDGWGENDH